ncbi:MAG: alanine:cation symporter family protein, partial [Gordonibacter sp.]|uniref:alanine:cation symporter family protein n=1 Tax=Gordonibacter sp. TaxID=1968902 RepID=UPI002FCB293B
PCGAAAFLGAVGIGNVVWAVSDIGNALMAIPNIVAILLLSGLVTRETRHYVYDNHTAEINDDPIPLIESK